MPHKVQQNVKSSISFAVNGKKATPREFAQAVQLVRDMKYQGEYEYGEGGRLVRKRR